MKKISKKVSSNNKTRYTWDLSKLYSSPTDPQIEIDMQKAEKIYADFAQKFGSKDTSYIHNDEQLLTALKEYEQLHIHALPKPIVYFFYQQSLNSSDSAISAQNALLSTRLAKASSLVTFFPIVVGSIVTSRQKEILKNSTFKHFHFLLTCMFTDAKHLLSSAEEKISALKNLPARELWVDHNKKILNSQTIIWNKKVITLNEAFELVTQQKTSVLRRKLADLVYVKLKEVAVFSEGEINAIFTDKKIEDELRNYPTPYAETVRQYRNEIQVVENLRTIVTDGFHIAHRFFRIKAKLLKQKKLYYSDRGAHIGEVKGSYSFDDSVNRLKDIFGGVDTKYASIIKKYIDGRYIDVYPRQGKTGGAYCSSTYQTPVYILLNHVDSLRSFTTLAHELGHAFHSELSENQGPVYSNYSYALAETASTLFEGVAIDSVLNSLPEKDQIILLHDKINESVATIFRQIACFNFELDLHQAIRTKGFVPKEEIAELHNKNMLAYLGPLFKMEPDNGYMFVSWSHIRRFFYVYSYAFGLIVSRALLHRYKQDPSFWKKIEQFLSAGGSESPEDILKHIGIDVTAPTFFKEGLKSVEEDIDKLEALL